MRGGQEALQANTKNLEDVFRSGERSSSSLEIMQVMERKSGREDERERERMYDVDGRHFLSH